MGFLNSSVSFTRFRILDPVPDDLLAIAPDKLKKFSFQDIDDLPEMTSSGWVCFDDMLDLEWRSAPPHKGEYLTFSFRVDTRRIPKGVIKKHLAMRLKSERERLLATNQKFISRDRIKEIKEQVLLKLRERFLPVPAEFNVVWNTRKHEVWFASQQSGIIDLFMELFLRTFELHLEQLTPFALAEVWLGENCNLDSLETTTFVKYNSPV